MPFTGYAPCAGVSPPFGSPLQIVSPGAHNWIVLGAYGGPIVMGGAPCARRKSFDGPPNRTTAATWLATSGGIGWGVPASVGVSLANPQRPVVCFSGDGSAMYSIQALWTAAHHKLPLNVVICNNGGYRIIKQRLLAFHGDDHYVGMDFVDPPVDFCGMAKSLGLEAIRISEPSELKAKFSDAFRRPGAKLIEVIVDGTV